MSAEFEYAMQQKKSDNIEEAKLYFEKAVAMTALRN